MTPNTLIPPDLHGKTMLSCMVEALNAAKLAYHETNCQNHECNCDSVDVDAALLAALPHLVNALVLKIVPSAAPTARQSQLGTIPSLYATGFLNGTHAAINALTERN